MVSHAPTSYVYVVVSTWGNRWLGSVAGELAKGLLVLIAPHRGSAQSALRQVRRRVDKVKSEFEMGGGE